MKGVSMVSLQSIWRLFAGSKFSQALSAVLSTMFLASVASASLVVVGSLQDEQGDPIDWDPPNSSLVMNDDGGGFYSLTVPNLVDGTMYEFKVLDDEGSPPANWGDPEIVNVNTMAYGDSDGSVDIWLDTNSTNGNGGGIVWVNQDNAPLQVVGDFMDEAGGAGDWNPSDATFAMTPQGSGYYTIDLTISTPGSYQFKATDGTGWDRQVGPDGLGSNAGVHMFSTTSADEAVTMYVDLAGRSIGIVPEPSALLIAVAGLVGFAISRRHA